MLTVGVVEVVEAAVVGVELASEVAGIVATVAVVAVVEVASGSAPLPHAAASRETTRRGNTKRRIGGPLDRVFGSDAGPEPTPFL